MNSLLVFGLMVLAPQAFAEISPSQNQNIEEMAKRVIELRQEVELLNEEYKTQREGISNKLKALSVQKAELASNIRSEKVRSKQLWEKMATIKKQMAEDNLVVDKFADTLDNGIEELGTYIRASLPVKKNERLAALSNIDEKLKAKEISEIRAASMLWSLYEDERRLARETNIYKQSIKIGDKMKLATLVKVGELFLYFKTDNGQVGMAKKVGNEWSFVTFKDSAKEEQTLAFIDALKKQIRTGYFELPTTI